MCVLCVCVCACVCVHLCACVRVCRLRTRTFWACKSRCWGKRQLPSPISFGAEVRVRGKAGTTMVVVMVRVVIKARPYLPRAHTSLMSFRLSFRRFGTQAQKSCHYQLKSHYHSQKSCLGTRSQMWCFGTHSQTSCHTHSQKSWHS